MKKKKEKALKELFLATKNQDDFRAFCLSKVGKSGVKIFLKHYVMVLFQKKDNRRITTERISSIKKNLSAMDDIVAELIFSASDESQRKEKIQELREKLSEIADGWPVQTTSVEGKIITKKIPNYLIQRKALRI